MSYDSPEDNRAFAERENFPYPLLSDVDRSAGAAYGVRRPDDHEWAMVPRRISFLINPQGVIHKIYVVKDLLGHPSQVLFDIEEASSTRG